MVTHHICHKFQDSYKRVNVDRAYRTRLSEPGKIITVRIYSTLKNSNSTSLTLTRPIGLTPHVAQKIADQC